MQPLQDLVSPTFKKHNTIKISENPVQPLRYLVGLTFKNMSYNSDLWYSGLQAHYFGIWTHDINNFGPESGRHGSAQAHTQSQRSHELQEGF